MPQLVCGNTKAKTPSRFEEGDWLPFIFHSRGSCHHNKMGGVVPGMCQWREMGGYLEILQILNIFWRARANANCM